MRDPHSEASFGAGIVAAGMFSAAGRCTRGCMVMAMLALAGCGGGASTDGEAQTVESSNLMPVIDSETVIVVEENTRTLFTVAARDADGDSLTYSIVGGEDAELFHIESHTGELSFIDAPDFDVPADSNGNNVYLVTVAVFDGDFTARQSFDITVVDAGLTINVTPGQIKTLAFSWPPVVGATRYTLFENPDDASGYAPVVSDIVAMDIEMSVPVHLTDWANSQYMLEGYDGGERISRSGAEGIAPFMLDAIGYLKASNTNARDGFGGSVALSADGNTLVVGARQESSSASGIDGDQQNNSMAESGAVYVFARSGAVWTQQVYIKADSVEENGWFGHSVALSADGNTLVVGAWGDSNGGIDQSDDMLLFSGAVYVYTRTGEQWARQAYLKAPNPGELDGFGESVTVSHDGNTLAVGAWGEDSASGDPLDNSADDAGAVYVFSRDGGNWTQRAYLKASNAEAGDAFGESVALSGDGNTLAVGAQGESGASGGINGDQDDNSAIFAGAVYLFTRADDDWHQQAYIKASNADFVDRFGESVTLSFDGDTLAVGAQGEASAAVGIGGDQDDNSAFVSGAVYAFGRSDGVWRQQAYIKASNTEWGDSFGRSVTLSADGNLLAVGGPEESSAAVGVDGDQTENDAWFSGAVYVFERHDDVWMQRSYIKAPNTGEDDDFGHSVSLSGDGNSLAVGGWRESSGAIGVGGDRFDNSASDAGAVFLY